MKQTAASELPAKHKNASHPSGWLVFFILSDAVVADKDTF